MKLPKEIFIDGSCWKIVRRWRIEHNGTVCDGLTVPDKKEIWIAHGIEKDELIHVFIHEFLHACLAEKGFYLTSLSEDMEELIVHAMTTGLLQNFSLKTLTRRSK